MAKSKGARIRVTLEHKCEQGVYRYHTSKNRRNTTERLELKKYSPVTKKHERFKETKQSNDLFGLNNFMIDNSFDKDTSKSIDFDSLTYKDTKILTNYLSEQGKILPRRISGLSPKQQKKVAKLIKTARIAALLPFVIGKG